MEDSFAAKNKVDRNRMEGWRREAFCLAKPISR